MFADRPRGFVTSLFVAMLVHYMTCIVRLLLYLYVIMAHLRFMYCDNVFHETLSIFYYTDLRSLAHYSQKYLFYQAIKIIERKDSFNGNTSRSSTNILYHYSDHFRMRHSTNNQICGGHKICLLKPLYRC